MVTVEVQPPSQVQAGAVMYPPLVVSSETDDSIDFIMIALVDSYGMVVDSLFGSVSASGKTLNDGSASRSSASKQYSAFSDLVIGVAGVYSIQVTAYQMDYAASGGGAVAASSTTTRHIMVYDESVAQEVATTAEQNLLRRLRRNGRFGVPSAPR
ncbi:hypothetical protein F5Y13DRAFT_189012 [Hypoxylon sp. FL1857]|nr:hypothetical protein F5Y13DRAFT_189012 [Hypoxylon sp. FL1857]